MRALRGAGYRPRMSTGRKKLARGVALGALVLLAAAAGLEGLLRLGWIENPKYRADRIDRRWAGTPRRLLVLGDSFLVPYGLLGRLLDAELEERGVALRNLAVSGTGPIEYKERLEQWLASGYARPHVVLLGYYAGNDLTDVQENPKYASDAASVAIRLDLPPLRPLVHNRWYHELHLFHWLEPMLVDPPIERVEFDWERFERAGIDPELIEDAKAGRINRWLLALARRNPRYLLDNILMDTDRNQRAWTRVRSLIGEIHGICAANGTDLCVVVFPRSIQIDGSHFEFFGKLGFQLDPRTLESTEPQTRLAAVCEELGVPLLDLLPDFEADGRQLYLEKDDHLNRDGYHFAAERIVPFAMRRFE